MEKNMETTTSMGLIARRLLCTSTSIFLRRFHIKTRRRTEQLVNKKGMHLFAPKRVKIFVLK